MSQRIIVYGLRSVAALIVAGLGGLALYISYLHMVELAHRSGVAGITAVAFPLTVDGLEIIAAAVLVYDRYARRRSGPLPWVVLSIGAAMSVAANAAVAPDNPTARGIYAMSAVCLIAAVKLLTHLLQPVPARIDQPTPTPPAGDAAPGQPEARPPDQATTPPPPAEGNTTPQATPPERNRGTDAPATPPVISRRAMMPVAAYQRRRVPGGIARRIPTSDDALQRWRQIWRDTARSPVATTVDAQRHGISKRTLQSIHAAGRAGLLDIDQDDPPEVNQETR